MASTNHASVAVTCWPLLVVSRATDLKVVDQETAERSPRYFLVMTSNGVTQFSTQRGGEAQLHEPTETVPLGQWLSECRKCKLIHTK